MLTEAEKRSLWYQRDANAPTKLTLAQRPTLAIDWGSVLGGMFVGGILTVLLIYGVIPEMAKWGKAEIRKRY